MNPKKFLTIGGIILVIVGLLGMVGILGPTAGQSIFGETWWFDWSENWTHLIVGVIALIVAFAASVAARKTVTTLVGVIALLAGVYGVFSSNLWGAELQNPADTILHLVIGVWALLSLRGQQELTAGAPSTPPSASPPLSAA